MAAKPLTKDEVLNRLTFEDVMNLTDNLANKGERHEQTTIRQTVCDRA
jgi:hypothetical protein